MQSQLEAALLGHSSTNVASSSQNDDEDNNFQDEGEEDIEDIIDEDIDGADNGHRPSKSSTGTSSTPRTVTLQMLLAADILQPGNGTMTIEYLGQKFVGDLLEDGKIRSQETDIVFASPSAWAIACKRFINPDKKSGCGWASVKYRGKKLDAYKNVWYKKKKEEQNLDKEQNIEMDNPVPKNLTPTMPYHRMVVKHNTIANRTITHDANTLIECVPFSNLGKIQPFLVSLSTNAALVMDFHCHLTKTEVCGYLAGHWDFNTHNLQICQAFPCRNTKNDRENAPQIENEISKAIEKEKLILVGWYHSHPFTAAAPTLRDIDAQLDYQIKMKGTSDNNYSPCIGIIISPYNYENNSLESSIISYWVIPPPETKPNEYGRPMLMSYSVIQDSHLTPLVKDEIKKLIEYYKKEQDYINFSDKYLSNTYYIDKLKATLISKFPRDESENIVWKFIKETLGYQYEENESLLSIPSVNKPSTSSLIPGLNAASLAATNFMLPTDISSLLFNSGKFPSASSLLGLPDPMAHSTLAANNMFLSTNLFKMQELLKPLTTSSSTGPITTKTKHSSSSSSSTTTTSSSSSTAIKIPNDIKHKDYYPDFKNFLTPETKSKIDYMDLFSKKDFTIPDLSKSIDFSTTLNLNRPTNDLIDRPPTKIPKNDFSMDLSCYSKNIDNNNPTDLSNPNDGTIDDKPLNLAAPEPPPPPPPPATTN